MIRSHRSRYLLIVCYSLFSRGVSSGYTINSHVSRLVLSIAAVQANLRIHVVLHTNIQNTEYRRTDVQTYRRTYIHTYTGEQKIIQNNHTSTMHTSTPYGGELIIVMHLILCTMHTEPTAYIHQSGRSYIGIDTPRQDPVLAPTSKPNHHRTKVCET